MNYRRARTIFDHPTSGAVYGSGLRGGVPRETADILVWGLDSALLMKDPSGEVSRYNGRGTRYCFRSYHMRFDGRGRMCESYTLHCDTDAYDSYLPVYSDQDGKRAIARFDAQGRPQSMLNYSNVETAKDWEFNWSVPGMVSVTDTLVFYDGSSRTTKTEWFLDHHNLVTRICTKDLDAGTVEEDIQIRRDAATGFIIILQNNNLKTCGEFLVLHPWGGPKYSTPLRNALAVYQDKKTNPEMELSEGAWFFYDGDPLDRDLFEEWISKGRN